jgi:SM-20-related protein
MSAGPTFELLRGASGRALVARFRDLGAGIDPDLRQQILAMEDRFVDASIGGAREDWRIGNVIYDPPEAGERIAARVREVAEVVAQALAVPLPAITDLERQLTVYGEGGYYKVHTDSRGPDAARRALSWVHYVAARLPPAFEGGALWVFDPEAPDAPPVEVTPDDGTTVFFPSELEHEVRPVRVPSAAFADGRFTVNGWVWR